MYSSVDVIAEWEESIRSESHAVHFTDPFGATGVIPRPWQRETMLSPAKPRPNIDKKTPVQLIDRYIYCTLTDSAINVVVDSIRLHSTGDSLLELHGEDSRVTPHPPQRRLAARQPSAVDTGLLARTNTYNLKIKYNIHYHFCFISNASGVYPGATIPSETSREMIRAVMASHSSDIATKSPNELIRSAPRAPAPAGETCLKLVAAGKPRASFSSFTNCHALRASHKLMKPGEPFRVVRGSLSRVPLYILIPCSMRQTENLSDLRTDHRLARNASSLPLGQSTGALVMSETSVTGRPALRMAVAVPPLATSPSPISDKHFAKGNKPVLSDTLRRAVDKIL
ncbi:hypothetical protein HW555_011483 [Spodoptera exigua]|uniref:Uncharacterized protein n=1 Tax=Spodoptera exigua TaxID=7107 RepID=A0A835L4K6_SPOEX|nr:hypothetical protein HW555_011483 [Spodoptera exigua]